MNYVRIAATLILVPGWSVADLADIRNYREYSPAFASAGQPTREQLSEVGEAGFERVVYIAFSNSGSAISDEDAVVKELGMDYVHIPVIWDAPTMSDFYAFAGAMQREPDKKTLLHCQANYRASAFAFLYRVLYLGVPIAEAKADMNAVWQPNETWRDLIFAVLEDNDVSPQCDGCDWSPGN
ncbi:MAG: protein tyrosine phosphatase family protein [Gammaproteobacteria bacterium]|nr:protein tyrosine phosphatase family protein [Gammaproteobacteria bacterium]